MTLYTLDGQSFRGEVTHGNVNQRLATKNTIYFPNTLDVSKAKILPAFPGWVRKPMNP